MDKFNSLSNIKPKKKRIKFIIKPKSDKETHGKGNNSLKNEDRFIENFNSNDLYRKDFFEKIKYNSNHNNWIAKKCNSKNGFIVKNTESWSLYKQESKEKSASPKTDVVIKNTLSNNTITLSLKSGEGRATSADSNEVNAIFKSVLDQDFNNDQELSIKVKDLCNSIQKDKIRNSKLTISDMRKKKNIENNDYKDEYLWFSNFCESTQKCNKIWEEIIEKYPNFKKRIIFECLSGKHKFDTNIGKAQFFVKLKNSSSTEIVDIIELDFNNDKIQQMCEKIGNKKKVFAGKSSGSTCWIRFL